MMARDCGVNVMDVSYACRILRERGIIRYTHGHYEVCGDKQTPPPTAAKADTSKSGPRLMLVTYMVAAGRERGWDKDQIAEAFRQLYAAPAKDGIDARMKKDERGTRMSAIEWLEQNGHIVAAVKKAKQLFPLDMDKEDASAVSGQ